MANTCDPGALFAAATCFNCYDNRQLLIIIAALLCQQTTTPAPVPIVPADPADWPRLVWKSGGLTDAGVNQQFGTGLGIPNQRAAKIIVQAPTANVGDIVIQSVQGTSPFPIHVVAGTSYEITTVGETQFYLDDWFFLTSNVGDKCQLLYLSNT